MEFAARAGSPPRGLAGGAWVGGTGSTCRSPRARRRVARVRAVYGGERTERTRRVGASERPVRVESRGGGAPPCGSWGLCQCVDVAHADESPCAIDVPAPALGAQRRGRPRQQ